jgi:hypothetical protein
MCTLYIHTYIPPSAMFLQVSGLFPPTHIHTYITKNPLYAGVYMTTCKVCLCNHANRCNPCWSGGSFEVSATLSVTCEVWLRCSLGVSGGTVCLKPGCGVLIYC